MKLNPARITTAVTALLGVALFSYPGYSATPGACKEDAKRLCADVKPGGGRIRQCLKEHEADLSSACKENISQWKEKREEKREKAHEACKADIQKLCADVKPGEGRIHQCLKAHESELSAACKEKMEHAKEMRHQKEHKAGMSEKTEGSSQTPPEPSKP
jgi:hypothetical protein